MYTTLTIIVSFVSYKYYYYFTFIISKTNYKSFPVFIIKILAYWYCHQEMHVRWGSTSTSSFHVSNGVKQGGQR